jgi:hypothetical protein
MKMKVLQPEAIINENDNRTAACRNNRNGEASVIEEMKAKMS